MNIKTKSKYQVLTEEKLNEIRAITEHDSQKSLGCLAQEARISKSSAETSHKCKIVKELSGIDM
jgi:hypothetical protein